MSIQLSTWEQRLQLLAREAIHRTGPALPEIVVDKSLLRRAYNYCDSLTSRHSRSFYLASALLPAEKRRAARALYAFCRVSDDIVDDSTNQTAATLTAWRRRMLVSQPAPDDPIALAWTDACQRHQIPQRYAEQLIDGVARDLYQTRYRTFSDLTTYAYGVASTVGLMSMHIIGFDGSQAIPYAIKLGVALQLTNILRDVGEDWLAGRVYLPQEELQAFELTEKDLGAGKVNDRWRAFMRFQIERNRRLYVDSWPGIAYLNEDGRLAISAAAHFYQAILADIEAHDYDVFNRRAYVGAWGKIKALPHIWRRTNYLPSSSISYDSNQLTNFICRKERSF